MTIQATYIWHDGTVPTQTLRSKMKTLCQIEDKKPKIKDKKPKIKDFPEWGFDGSSTNQSQGHDSDLILKPVRHVVDPILGKGNFLVLCEVFNPDGSPHETNKRAKLRAVMDAGGAAQEPWVGFEQEYTLFDGTSPLGWPDRGYPAPQGPFYCGVGANEAFGRQLVEDHTQACLDAGLMLAGTNAEVMPGQWEFQIGYRGDDTESADPLTICDHLWLARWLLRRIGENCGISVSLENKPVKGDWNGAGKHTNFSTKATRDPKIGMKAINRIIENLRPKHEEYIKLYGHGLEERLTGEHETASINEFSSGVADRGCSIRIPRAVANQGYGYFEDRRPGANANPYEVAAALVSVICE